MDLIAILLQTALSLSAAAPETFGDGIAEYECVEPLEGYFVPRSALRPGYGVPLAAVLSDAREMTQDELRAFFHSGASDAPLATNELPLFAFENQGQNVFLWTGERIRKDQQVIPRVWDGSLWHPDGYNDGRSDAIERVFALPGSEARAWILVDSQSGGGILRTTRVRFGRFPGTEAILRRGLETSDAVVYLPQARRGRAPSSVDCVAGRIDRAMLECVPGFEALRGNTLVYLREKGAGHRIAFSYRCEELAFTGAHGTVRDPLAREWDSPLRSARWLLARGDIPEGSVARFSHAGTGAERGVAAMFELVVGRERPLDLFARPITRALRDGGKPLFRFEVERGDESVSLAPSGRFGEDSFFSKDAERCEALAFDYRFIPCGPGVVKLAMYPRERPFDAEVRAFVTPTRDPFDRVAEEILAGVLALSSR